MPWLLFTSPFFFIMGFRFSYYVISPWPFVLCVLGSLCDASMVIKERPQISIKSLMRNRSDGFIHSDSHWRWDGNWIWEAFISPKVLAAWNDKLYHDEIFFYIVGCRIGNVTASGALTIAKEVSKISISAVLKKKTKHRHDLFDGHTNDMESFRWSLSRRSGEKEDKLFRRD